MLSMKPVLLVALVLLLAVVLVPQHVQAREHDVPTWTKEKISEFMDKYKIKYDRNTDQSAMLRTLNTYRDAAAENAQLFGDKIDQVTSNLRTRLQKQQGLSENNLNILITDLQHHLRQLELQGDLSRDRVQQTLDRMHRHLIRRKIVTEAQWRTISGDVMSSFETQTWYQRVLGRRPADISTGSSSLNRWLQRVGERVESLKTLSEEQVTAVVDQMRQSVTSIKDLSRLGDTHWLQTLGQRLEKNAKLTHDQAQSVIQSVETDINAYKIFAMEYAGQTVEQTKHVAHTSVDMIKQCCHRIMQSIYDFLFIVDGHLRKIWPSALSQRRMSTSEKIQHAHSSVASRASRAAVSATSAVGDKTEGWKHSFAQFWRDSEMNAYRRLGYTEGQVDHIQRYLAKTFKRDHQSMTRKNVDEALQQLKRYLQDTQVQSAAQVQHQVDKLGSLFESWKAKAKKSK